MFQHFAVIGNPIVHSLSPIIHRFFAQQATIQLMYEKIKSEIYDFEQVVADFFKQGGQGLNVTLPFKQRAFAIAQQRSFRCQQARAANTLWMKEHQLHADNTDGVGFIRDLRRYLSVRDKRVLILGAGGAARGIINPLLEEYPEILAVASRTSVKADALQLDFPQIKCMRFDEVKCIFDLVINATSASLLSDFMALPMECMVAKPFCYDLSYQQQGVTAFVQYARNLSCQAIDGLGMLVEQAAEAFFIWHGILPETRDIFAYLRP